MVESLVGSGDEEGQDWKLPDEEVRARVEKREMERSVGSTGTGAGSGASAGAGVVEGAELGRELGRWHSGSGKGGREVELERSEKRIVGGVEHGLLL